MTSAGTYFKRPAKALIFFSLLIVSVSCAAPQARLEPGLTGYAVASWYGPQFHGNLTASGEVYDMYGYTAAHKTLPFGSRFRMTYPATGKSVEIVVNDRGPYVRGRQFDLSYGAAKALGTTGVGVATVKYEYLGRDPKYVKDVIVDTGGGGTVAVAVSDTKTVLPVSAGTGAFTIQVGSFKDYDNAKKLEDVLNQNYTNIYLRTVLINGEKHYRVRLGKFSTREKAMERARLLAGEGYTTLVTGFD